MFQEKALAIMKSGRNVFLTGSAGTGKTYVLNQYIQYLYDHKVPVAVTASTGIAATHMNGTTIHSWSGIGIKEQLSHNDLRSLNNKKYLKTNLEKTHVLIIDEISMLHRRQLDMVNQALKYLRKSSLPFGGMQVIFSGDFFQLPPVSKQSEPNREKFAFMSNAWVDAAPTVCYLTEQFRQSKNSLNNILNELRTGEVTESSVSELLETRYQEIAIEPTRLYTHNLDVDQINRENLDKIEGPSEVYFAEKKGNQKLMDSFVNSLIVQDKIELKKGAKVMFLKNNHEKGVMNGTLGVVVDFGEFPIVKLSDGRKVEAAPEIWSIDNEKGSPIVTFQQVPLRLAWAITVHKSQGMTLEAAEVDLGKTFEKGQGYVALSRLRDIEGLRLLGLNRVALEVDALAAKADARFMELSELSDELSLEDLEKKFEDHIIDSGGTTDPNELAKQRSKRKGKQEKKSTFELTKELIEEGKDVDEIAGIRGVTRATVVNHVISLVKENPDLDISNLKPDSLFLKKVESAAEAIKNRSDKSLMTPDGKPKVSALHREMKQSWKFEDIKLALLYI